MPKYIAFLRAINVGGHTVKMGQLKSLFEELGHSNVETFIASGNVIFDSKSTNVKTLEQKIEKHLQGQLGYAVETFIRSPLELVAIANYKPFSEAELSADGNVLYVGFLRSSPDKSAKEKLISMANPVDDVHLFEREIYLLRRRNVGESEFSGALVEKILGMKATLRNVNTVRRLVAKYPVR